MALHLLYGVPPPGLADPPAGAVQTSPLEPGARLLEEIAPGEASAITMVVPPGTVERRYALALALSALAPGGQLTAMASRDKGGARIAGDLARFGCVAAEDARRHWRLCRALRPPEPANIDAALAEGGLRFDPALGLWTQPGVFSWNRIDEGSALLIEALGAQGGALAGHGADLGAGLGLLSRAVLARGEAVRTIEAVERDARAIAAARRNLPDPRVVFHWRDVRESLPFAGLDFVVMNPPFHSEGRDDLGLGLIFLRRAREVLRPGGRLLMVANRHLPYEGELAALFARTVPLRQGPRFKVVEAIA